MPPNLANGRGHTRWNNHKKKHYFKSLDQRQGCGLLPPPPKVPLSPVELTAVMYLGGKMDDDNAKFRAYKWTSDWLRTRGYIVDDKRPHCRMIDPEQIITRNYDYRIIITITPQSQDPK